MGLTALHRWHWVVLGLVCGLVYGSVRSCSTNFAEELDAYGRRIGQREFERSIVTRYQDRPAFKDLVVYPYRLTGSSAGAEQVYVVSGLYCDGQPHEQNGRSALQWKPGYFVASSPFRPMGLAGAAKSTAEQFDTVMGFLSSKGSAGVTFRYATFWWATRPLFVGPAAGLVLIGLAWPTVLNLLVFGTFTRPRQPKGVSLATVASAPATAPKPPAPEIDLEAVAQLDRELESTLVNEPPAPAAATATTSVPRQLAAETVEAVDAFEEPPKEFGAKQEDFYPTELGTKHERQL